MWIMVSYYTRIRLGSYLFTLFVHFHLPNSLLWIIEWNSYFPMWCWLVGLLLWDVCECVRLSVRHISLLGVISNYRSHHYLSWCLWLAYIQTSLSLGKTKGLLSVHILLCVSVPLCVAAMSTLTALMENKSSSLPHTEISVHGCGVCFAIYDE